MVQYLPTIAAVSAECVANAGKIERNVSSFQNFYLCNVSGLIDISQYVTEEGGLTFRYVD